MCSERLLLGRRRTAGGREQGQRQPAQPSQACGTPCRGPGPTLKGCLRSQSRTSCRITSALPSGSSRRPAVAPTMMEVPAAAGRGRSSCRCACREECRCWRALPSGVGVAREDCGLATTGHHSAHCPLGPSLHATAYCNSGRTKGPTRQGQWGRRGPPAHASRGMVSSASFSSGASDSAAAGGLSA